MTSISTSCNIDVIFTDFSTCRSGVVNLVNTSKPEDIVTKLYEEYISVDRDCLCNLGKHFNELKSASVDVADQSKVIKNDNAPLNECVSLLNDSIRRSFSCKACLAIDSMTNLSESIANGAPFCLETGNKVNHKVYIRKCNLLSSSNKKFTSQSSNYINNAGVVTDRPRKYLEQLLPLTDVDLMTSRLRTTTYLSLDSFTNSILINWIVDRLLTDKGFGGSTDIAYCAFICSSEGYTLHDYYEELNVSSLKKSYLSPMINRFVKILQVLEASNYSHGLIDANSISFAPMKKVKDGPVIKVILSNFEYSSITVDGRTGPLRLYQRNDIADVEMEGTLLRFPFSTEDLEDTTSKSSSIKMFKLGTRSHSQKMFVKHLGLPFYTSSYNTYRLMLVLLSHPLIYSVSIDDDFVNSVLTCLFPDVSLCDISKEMKNLSLTSRTNNDINNFIENKYMLTDPIKALLKLK